MAALAAYWAWKQSVFGTNYMIWHDGLNTQAVTVLAGEARKEALAMLRLGLDSGDTHAAQALAAMGEAGALDAVRAQIATSRGIAQVRAVLAAHELSPDPSLAAFLIKVLKTARSWSARIDAAIGLRRFRGADDEEALLEAVARDPKYLVRYHASESLLLRWGVRPAGINEYGEILDRLRGPDHDSPSAEDFASFTRARRMLEALRQGGLRRR